MAAYEYSQINNNGEKLKELSRKFRTTLRFDSASYSDQIYPLKYSCLIELPTPITKNSGRTGWDYVYIMGGDTLSKRKKYALKKAILSTAYFGHK